MTNRDTSVNHFLEPLRPYLQDKAITEIVVNRPGQIYYETRAGWESEDAPLLTYDHLHKFGIAAAKYTGENLTFQSETPILSAMLPGGERAQFVMPPACRPETVSLTIRKPALDVRELDCFIADGLFSQIHAPNYENLDEEELFERYKQIYFPPKAEERRATFLRRCVELGKNIVIAGETGSGKTTFMKALMQCIPTNERIITIEDVPELVYGLPKHDNQVNLFYPSEGGADSTVTASSLLRSCLRMKPDRILLGELRGGETYDFLNVCFSGHGGSITSCHAGSCTEVFDYLALKVLQSDTGRTIPYDKIRELLFQTIDVVVHIHNDRRIGRHITEIWFDPSVKKKGDGKYETFGPANLNKRLDRTTFCNAKSDSRSAVPVARGLGIRQEQAKRRTEGYAELALNKKP